MSGLLPAPKDPRANVRYRRRIIEAARNSKPLQEEIWLRCKQDPIWYVDTFGWTYSPKDFPDCPNRPFILWGFQEEAFRTILAAIGNNDLLVEKSRDMGASWLCNAAFLYRWHFFEMQSFLVGSRKEEYVDKAGDPKSMFWKLDYFIENLPGWLRPNYDRTRMHLVNLSNGSTIDGESTNDDFARGDRRTAILLDEFPAVENGHKILPSTRDATSCRIFNGTPQGAQGAYYDTRKVMQSDNPERIIRLHWSRHPLKSVGLYSTVNNVEGGALQFLDANYNYDPNYPYILDGKVRSIWYDEQCRRAASKQEIAQELDIDYAASGWQYFDQRVLDRLILDTAKPPLYRGELIFKEGGKKPFWEVAAEGRLQIWCDLNPLAGHTPPLGDYVVGCDIATGSGGEWSSNSVASVVNRKTGTKVAQFTSNRIRPDDFADYAIAICNFFCNDGSTAFLVWEQNGPGNDFSKRVGELKYRRVYYRDDDETSFAKKKTRKPGWWSSKTTKRILISDYARALLSGSFVNRCEAALQECGEYVHNLDGSIEHSRSRGTLDATAYGENHGDMVIADALASRGMTESVFTDPVDEEEEEVPPNCFLERRRKARQAKPESTY